ncbi:MAG: amidohydrolase [Candidatus Eisenbacteria bacterium]|nr:amidohydrolase [Candidatus Eisenbacteria bacterium]
MSSTSGFPRTVLYNCNVWCGNKYSKALSVNRGLIEHVGSKEKLKALTGRSTLWVDLEGATVMPGFVDSHIHLDGLSREGTSVKLKGTSSPEEVVSRLKPFARKVRPGGWLLGRGWDSNMWSSRPSLDLLDGIRSDIHVALVSNDGHSVWGNSKALRKAEVSAKRSRASGFVVEKIGRKATGVLKENAAESLLSVVRKEMPLDEDSIRKTLFKLAKLGIVGVHDFSQSNLLGLLMKLESQGKLPVRVRSFLPLNMLPLLSSLEITSGFGSNLVRIMGVKAFIDGSLTSRTALMISPYEGLKREKGVLTISMAELLGTMRAAFLSRVMYSVHAIGDMANRMALDSYEKVRLELGTKARNLFRVEHAQLLDPKDIPRFGRLGVFSSMQPVHAVSDMETAELLWGKRVRYSYPWNSLLKSKARLVFGSDAPVESPDPLVGLHAAVTRRRNGRESWVKEECIDSRNAALAYTLNPAALEGEADLRGSIEEGKSADLAVLSRDVLRCEADKIPDTRVLATFSSGKVSFVSPFLEGKLAQGA